MRYRYRKKEEVQTTCQKRNTSCTQRPVVCILYQRLKAHLEGGLAQIHFISSARGQAWTRHFTHAPLCYALWTVLDVQLRVSHAFEERAGTLHAEQFDQAHHTTENKLEYLENLIPWLCIYILWERKHTHRPVPTTKHHSFLSNSTLFPPLSAGIIPSSDVSA